MAAGGLLFVRKRNRKQQEQLAKNLSDAAAELERTEAGYRALVDLLPRAAATLDYLATHAGHAVGRWADRLGDPPRRWDALKAADRQAYLDFIAVAAAQLTIVNFPFGELLTGGPSERDGRIALADQTLTTAHTAVTDRF